MHLTLVWKTRTHTQTKTHSRSGTHLGVEVADLDVLEPRLLAVLRQGLDQVHGRGDRACSDGTEG